MGAESELALQDDLEDITATRSKGKKLHKKPRVEIEYEMEVDDAPKRKHKHVAS